MSAVPLCRCPFCVHLDAIKVLSQCWLLWTAHSPQSHPVSSSGSEGFTHQSFSTLSGAKRCRGIFTVIQCPTLRARRNLSRSFQYGLREEHRWWSERLLFIHFFQYNVSVCSQENRSVSNHPSALTIVHRLCLSRRQGDASMRTQSLKTSTHGRVGAIV